MFGRRRRDEPEPECGPLEVYRGLRDMLFDLDPAQAGLPPAPDGSSAWGFAMDTGYASATVTLACLRDGTTSLYTSSGFGIIGGGQHEEVVAANRRLFATLDDLPDVFVPNTDRSLPGEGQTVLRCLTREGPRVHRAAEDDLGERRDPLWPLFYAAQDVLTQLRLIHEARQAQQ